MRVILLLVLAGFLAITGLICLITGIVLLTRDTPCDQITPKISEKCSYSEEAVRGSLDTFLQKVQDSHYRLHPNRIAYKPRVSPPEIALMTRLRATSSSLLTKRGLYSMK